MPVNHYLLDHAVQSNNPDVAKYRYPKLPYNYPIAIFIG